MALELNVARLQGKLAGSTAEERFRSFVQLLRTPAAALAIFHEYPVLARQVITALDLWVKFSLEFCGHLVLDSGDFTSLGAPANVGLVYAIEGSKGDSHQGGKSVQVVTFSSGWRVVYKPRSLAVDVHFQALLAWLHNHGFEPAFRTLLHLDRGGHGWSEYVVDRPCETRAEVRRFYVRQGACLALLYALHATDFHFENIIAAGEFPLLIDLESLFQPAVEARGGGKARLADGDAADFSVLRVGLLPQFMRGDDAVARADLSGMATVEGQLTPRAVPRWDNPGTDTMRLISRRLRMGESRNRPHLAGTDVNPADYTRDIVEGFTRMCRLIVRRRDELLASDGPLSRFETDQVRVVVRPTMIYEALLWDSLHPDTLRDALDRDRFLDRLWVGVPNREWLARIIGAEREDLMKGDIPLFSTRPGSSDLRTSSGKVMCEVFAETGMHCATEKIRSLNEEDLARQQSFIRASMALLDSPVQVHVREFSAPAEIERISRDRLVAESRAIGERLMDTAYRGRNGATWIGLGWINQKQWTLSPLGPSLYDGLSGVILYLAYLGAICGGPFILLAEEALANLGRLIQQQRSHFTPIGAFSGWGGFIYLLAHLGTLWRRPDLFAEAEEMVEMLPPLIAQDRDLDLLTGTAGCLAALCVFHEVTRSDRALSAAIQCGNHLCASAEVLGGGLGWKATATGGRPLTGFSHGAAGIGFALMLLAEITGDPRFSATARGAMDYERSTFLATEQNWPDHRDSDLSNPEKPNAKCMTAWCHGAPGIGLSRVAVLSRTNDPALSREIEVAVRTTIASGFGKNHSLCHGDLGNLELLLEASQVLGDPLLTADLDRFVAAIVEGARKEGWICGTPSSIESPSLMTGLSGIGYELLRLAYPAEVPSLLTLAPPPHVNLSSSRPSCSLMEAGSR